jgi:hypothetical protein
MDGSRLYPAVSSVRMPRSSSLRQIPISLSLVIAVALTHPPYIIKAHPILLRPLAAPYYSKGQCPTILKAAPPFRIVGQPGEQGNMVVMEPAPLMIGRFGPVGRMVIAVDRD